jgi:hypothetical protein
MWFIQLKDCEENSLWRRVILCKKEGHHIVGGLVFRTADEGRG